MLSEGSTPEEDTSTTQHFNYLKGLMQAGVVILAGRSQTTDYSSFGIIIFKAEDEAAAWKIVHNDPAVQAKQFRAELYPYRIALLEPENV
jgi:uncharacterized protein YciI